MLSGLVALTLYALSATTAAYGSPTAPDCVSKCWSYSQYLSLACKGDTMCLCEDADFQNAVYQCLYSQCSTSKFGTALHHALGYCAGNGAKPGLISAAPSQPSPEPTPIQQPALLKINGLLKRAGGYYGNTKSVTHTHKHHHSASHSIHKTHTMTRAIVTEISDGQPQAPTATGVVTAVPKVPANAMYRMAHDRHHGKGQDKGAAHKKGTVADEPHEPFENIARDL